ncbi:MAG TPA: NAD(P)/FAD-dependent oxidoreductase [Flavipsychrobacter sp.]|nr:NAD(P)/FAD-dependent oxidoreductase [Flavipsychrobacter sp.]
MKKERIAIIGAGAAGCFAAANIPHTANREVVVLEKTGKALQKVKVSGGGRCNTTHHLFDIPELIERYPRGKQFLRKTLYEFGPQQTIDWFEKRRVQLKTEADGRMFPDTDNSETIIDCIWQEMMKQKVQVQYHKSVVKLAKVDGAFEIHFADGIMQNADKVLVACGGFPKEEQYKWLQQLGHSIQLPVPSLFTFNLRNHPITELMGVSVPNGVVKINGTKIIEPGPILITHWGLSGPAILRASAWGARELHERNYDFQVQINWLGTLQEQELKEIIVQLRREQGKQFIAQKNPFELPRRLWEFLLKTCSIAGDIRWGDLPSLQQNKLVEHLIRNTFHVAGKTTFKEEFVTCGGVVLSEINPKTLESKIVSGLYFAGEVLDVDGITGGFNFQHAWASGYLAAKAIANS